jgi:ssDNA-binding Zn-finger/Zn-ribbon topoisomerase 1
MDADKLLKDIPAIDGMNKVKTTFKCPECGRQLTVFEWRTDHCLNCKTTTLHALTEKRK